MHDRSLIARLLFVIIPAAFLVTTVWASIWGDEGVIARQQVARELNDSQMDLASLERENQRLLYDLRSLEQDPRALERAAAEELGWARPGATIYRFDSPSQTSP